MFSTESSLFRRIYIRQFSMESTANLMIFYGIRRKFYKFHGKQQNAMANLEMGVTRSKTDLTKCDPTVGIGDIVSFLGPYIIFESNAETETQETQPRLRLMPSTLSDLSYQCGCTLQEVETEEGHILKFVFVRKNLTCEVNMKLTLFYRV